MRTRRRVLTLPVVCLLLLVPAAAQPLASSETIDYDAIYKIKDEGFQRSQVMETVSYLTDVYGPRLTGSPNIKQDPARDPHTKGVELRDLYNREDAFALSEVYRPLYESRFDANLAFFDKLDSDTAWPLRPDGRHPLSDLLMDDFLILDLARAFTPGGFLEIERALLAFAPTEPPAGAGSTTTSSTTCSR